MSSILETELVCQQKSLNINALKEHQRHAEKLRVKQQCQSIRVSYQLTCVWNIFLDF